MLAQRKKTKETGQGLVEYALILVMVAVVVIVVLSLVGPQVGNIFSEVVTVLKTGRSTECVIESPCENDILRVDLNVDPPAKKYSYQKWTGSTWIEIEKANSPDKMAYQYNCTVGSGQIGCPA